MELVFVRHGQSMGNMTGDYSIETSDRLSPLGWEQAERLVQRLERKNFEAIYVSPLRRALETALPFLKSTGRTAEVWPRLAEACWQQDRDAQPPEKRLPRLPLDLPSGADGHYEIPSDFLMPYEDETYPEGLSRIAETAQMLRNLYGGRPVSILILGHGHAGGRLIEMMLGREVIGSFGHANTAHSRLLERDDGTFELVEQNVLD